MKVLLILTSLLWMLSMNVSAADIHDLFSCGEMTGADTMVEVMTDHHGPEHNEPGHNGHDEDCGDGCCDGACLCKVAGSSMSALPFTHGQSILSASPDALAAQRADSFNEALHLLTDPPPRSRS
ncbi:MAG: hypothetical protein MRY59_10595 [Aquisalinus sp.]|nr:hypothetical protein [Aquisalinus sp.]